MRIFKAILVAIAFVFGFVGIAQADTFDGTNHNPVYTEGITEVYAVTDNGIPVYVPVWSMERCIHDDGSSQVACVWHSPTQGNKDGAVSFMKLGGNEFATISHESARILLAENANVQVNYVPENVVEFDGSLPYKSVDEMTDAEFEEYMNGFGAENEEGSGDDYQDESYEDIAE